jgi:hypothetical protein
LASFSFAASRRRFFSFFFWQPEDGKPIANAHQQKAIFGWVGELKANG